MLVHSFFDFNLHIPANAAWFAVLAGMACAPKAITEARRGSSGWWLALEIWDLGFGIPFPSAEW